MLYPAEAAEAAAAEEGATEDERLAALDARLDGLMDAVKLRYLVAREGGWAVTHEWGDTLSLGASQVSSFYCLLRWSYFSKTLE